MANKLLLWLLARFLHERRQARLGKRRGRGAPRSDVSQAPTESTAAPPPPDLGQRLVGRAQPHNRILLVPRDRIVLVLEDGQPTAIARPKTYLWPPIVPSRRPMTLLVVNTGVVQLILKVRDLVTVDGYAISQVTVKVAVQLTDGDGYGKLARTAAEAGGGLEQQLLDRVERELGNEIQVAVRMNRLGHLRRLTLSEVLTLRGLPEHLAGGVLDLRAVEVTAVGWPADAPAAAPAPAPAGTGTRAQDAPATDPSGGSMTGSLDLTTDAKLRRLWLTHSEVDLDGIASARVGGAATVVAVPRRTPGLADLLAVKEAFRRQFDDRSVTVVAAPATSYADLVQGWFRQIEASPVRLVAVRPSSRDGLRIIVEQAQRSGDGELRVGTPSDREALRTLLPHSRIEFVASDEAAALSERMR